MITFNNKEAYIWIWLPNQILPVVAGKIEKINDNYDFFYGKSYIENRQAIALNEIELPLLAKQRFTSPSRLPFVFRDALPDAWGQRLLQHFYYKEILTPAYDLCPYPRYGHEATQAMIVGKDGAYSTLKNAISAANRFELSAHEAIDIINEMIEHTKTYWPEACIEAQMTPIQQKQFERAILNPFIFTE